MAKVIGGAVGGGGKGTSMHFKIGGGGMGSSIKRMFKVRGGSFSGLPPKAANPFKTAKMTTNRSIGLAKMPGKGIY